MFSSRPSSLAHKLLMLLFMLASLVRADQVFSTLLVPVGTTGHNHTVPLNLFRAFPCAPPYARSIFWWSPLLFLSWSPSHGNYPFIEHPPDMHVQHFWNCNISLRISIARRKIPLKFTYLGIKNAVGRYNLIRTGENYDPALGTCLYVSIRDLHGNL